MVWCLRLKVKQLSVLVTALDKIDDSPIRKMSDPELNTRPQIPETAAIAIRVLMLLG